MRPFILHRLIVLFNTNLFTVFYFQFFSFYSVSSQFLVYQQASLFRIFQRVFDTPKDAHHEELRRLAIYVIRQFAQIAPSNPKIFAELLFYKSIREANDIENGYDGVYMEQ